MQPAYKSKIDFFFQISAHFSGLHNFSFSLSCSVRMETVAQILFLDAFLSKNSNLLNAESKKIQQEQLTGSNFRKIRIALQEKDTQNVSESPMTA